MADTRIENAIVEAILIITDKRIALAGYDKTIKGIINNVLDSAAGKYEIKYQDSLFEAYATSSDLSYQIGQMVSILIPDNDWSRVKTILGGISNQTLIQNEIPVASNQYNQIGMSATTVNNAIGLSSYKPDGDSIILVLNGLSTDSSYLNMSSDAYDYIKKGDSLAFKMVVRTSLAPSQVGGDYGVIFRLVFKDGNGLLTIRNYIVSNKHVIGQPYALQAYTPVEVLYTDVDTENFIRIDSIQAFCEGFPEDETKENVKDIFISGISINGADALTEDLLKGYTMHILDSDGRILTESKKLILLTAQLKSKGKIVTLNVEYYWGIEDGTVFKGSDKYCGWLGDGWRCLNSYDLKLRSYIPYKIPDFYFTTYLPEFDLYDGVRNKALARDRNSNIICLAVLQGNSFDGYIEIKNLILSEIKIVSSLLDEEGKNKVVYFLDNGHPDLTCWVDNSEETNGYTYKWSVFPRDGKGELKEEKPYPIIDESTGDTIYVDKYVYFKSEWNKVINKLNKIAGNQQSEYKETAEYINAKDNIELVLSAPYVYKNIYYNFPIKEISGSMKVSCTVLQGETYIGTGSITLLNRRQLEGMYSLNIENGLQVFQYDTKGNSPASSQLLKPLLILPLSFTLVDNKGKLVTHQQIRLNGWIKWIIPNTQTMLLSDKSDNKNGQPDNPTTGGVDDIVVIRASLPLDNKYWDVYTAKDNRSFDSFYFNISDRYDSKNNINYIWLNVKYKDMIFDAYTDFSFPKDGDPGTNGTDLVAKITPSLPSDRLYISNKNTSLLFNDQGAEIQNLKFLLYNNSKKLENISASNWTTPPKTKNGNKEDIKTGRKSYLSVSPVSGATTKVSFTNGTNQVFSGNSSIQTDKPVNIIRAQYGTGNNSGDLRYYAEIPVCTNYIKNGNYRIKVKPKTGFNYVVYNSDGTSPDYDNTMPFEIIVEKLVGLYYMTEQETYTYTFDTIGNLKNGTQNENKYTVLPKDSYNGYDLSSAVICQVKQGSTEIGFIHIPIYMIINRYNNRALNSWDGNSVQIDKNGNGEILTPQIAAGAKDSDNAFTGMLMGQIALNTANDDIGTNGDIGLMGYDSGVRTVFLDAKTGKAEFGKNNQGKIIIDPDTTINEQASALLYSNTFDKSKYITAAKAGNPASTVHNIYNSGLMIDLTSPAIQFGSGRFYVDKNGNIHAAGAGDVAGWQIDDSAFYKHDGTYKTGMRSSGDPAFYAGINAQNNNTPGSLTAYNFFVNHNGYLYSKSGQIAGWDITSTKLHKDNKVGMASSNETIPTNIKLGVNDNDTVAFWAGGVLNTSGTNKGKLKDANFYTTHGGFLFSKLGKIANWNISTSMLTDGNIGMGQYTFPEKDQSNNKNPFGKSITARLWGGDNNIAPFKIESNGKISFDVRGLNFAVSSDGSLYSKKGKIGGWNILEDKLWAGSSVDGQKGIRINDNGSLDGQNWSIKNNGNAYFKNIYGQIKGNTKGDDPSEKVVYLTGGSYTTDSTGARGGSAGTGYYLGSDGTMGIGNATAGMTFDTSGLTVKGTIKADAGYIGSSTSGWSIGDKGIYSGSNHIYPTGIELIKGDSHASITPNQIFSNYITATQGFKIGPSDDSTAGKTGDIIFSNKAKIIVKGGIITGVKKGEDDDVTATGNLYV